jgi:hypothetical protein
LKRSRAPNNSRIWGARSAGLKDRRIHSRIRRFYGAPTHRPQPEKADGRERVAEDPQGSGGGVAGKLQLAGQSGFGEGFEDGFSN